MAGFVYVTDEGPISLERAEAGSRVSIPSLNPPWIVVHDLLEEIGLSRWPGRLFRAQVVPPEKDAERAAMSHAARDVSPDDHYVRAIAVDLLEEISPALLFGPHGESVIRVIDAGRELDQAGAQRLDISRHPSAGKAYSRAWHQWLIDQSNSPPYLETDFEMTTLVSGPDFSGSPLGKGLAVVSDAVRKSARLRGRPGIIIDEDGEQILAPAWSAACAALLHAAIALGAPELMKDNYRDVVALTKAWNAVYDVDR